MQIFQRLRLLHLIHLVKDCYHRLIADLQLTQRIIYDIHLRVHLQVRRIDHMEDNITITCLLQRTLERLDQMVRQFADESDRICQQDLQSARQL